MSFLKNLNWRYATKKFSLTNFPSEIEIQNILEAIRMTPTSFGIMPFRVIVITNKSLQNTLKAASWNQNQIDTASHLLVFVARTDLENITDEFFNELSENDEQKRKSLENYENMVINFIQNIPEEKRFAYASEQVHIALGFALAAAAELRIDSCAIGGFDAKKYQEILGLQKYEQPSIVLALGKRDENEIIRNKFRPSSQTIFSFQSEK